MLRFAKIMAPMMTLGLLAACGAPSSQLTDIERAGPYQLDFTDQPSFVSSNFLALTFDDVPDWNNTAHVLDVLRDKGVRATFFVNTNNWSDVANEQPMQDLIRRMANEGHLIGNHTAHHPHLTELSPGEIETEIATVEQVVRNILGPSSAPLTLLRAPYGEPYQVGDPGSADYQKVSSIIARHAVHVGWNLDDFDYNCGDGDGGCVHDNVMSRVNEGAYGVVLMHGVYSATVNALPGLIDELRQRGFVLGSVEDMVRARYGATSRQLLNK